MDYLFDQFEECRGYKGDGDGSDSLYLHHHVFFVFDALDNTLHASEGAGLDGGDAVHDEQETSEDESDTEDDHEDIGDEVRHDDQQESDKDRKKRQDGEGSGLLDGDEGPEDTGDKDEDADDHDDGLERIGLKGGEYNSDDYEDHSVQNGDGPGGLLAR